MRLDAGTATSAVLEGFVPLTLDGSPDARARWSAPAQRADGPGRHDPLLDGVWGGELTVTVPAGTYELAVLWGMPDPVAPDLVAWAEEPPGLVVQGVATLTLPPTTAAGWFASPWHAANPRPVFHPDETSWHRQTAPRLPWHRQTVTVGAEGLVLSAHGAPLDALVLAPAGELDALLDATDAARARAWSAQQPLSAAWASPSAPGPLGVSEVPWGAPPAPDGPTSTLRWTLAADDRAAHFLWVHGADEAIHWSIEGLDDLILTVHEADWLDASGHDERDHLPRPLVLRPSDGLLRGGQGLPPAAVLTLRSTPDTPPGRHKGTLRLEHGDTTTTVRLVVEVADLSLPAAPVPYGLSVQLPEPLALWGTPDERLLWWVATLQILREAGLETLGLRQMFWPGQHPLRTGPPGLAEVPELADWWARHGGRRLFWSDLKTPLRARAYGRTDEPALSQDDAAGLRPLLAQIAALPVPDPIVGFWEEETWRHAGALRRGGPFFRRLQALAPDGVQLMVNGGHPAAWAMAEHADVLSVGDLPPLSSEHINLLRGRVPSVVTYNISPGRSGPLTAWTVGSDAHLQWTWSPLPVAPFDPFRTKAAWFYGLTDTTGLPVGTTSLEAVAAGVRDTRWLAGLSACTRALAASDHPKDRALAHQGHLLLAATRRAFDGAPALHVLDGERLPPQALEALHAAVSSLLIQQHDRAPGCTTLP